jgi:hypothetical protein
VGSRTAHNVNYQQRALEFAVDDIVFPYELGSQDVAGRVVQVFPAIGVVDVEFPNGVKQYPVEDLQRVNPENVQTEPTEVTQNVPGGAGGVSTSGGPPREAGDQANRIRRIAEAFVKKSLYWGSRDRKYRATRAELEANNYTCPKCKEGQLRRAIYKRMEGKSERLMGCGNCLFLIKSCDIMGHPDNEEVL